MVSSLTTLPDEILHTICLKLDTSSLLSLCRTCNALRLATEPHIWETLDLVRPIRRLQTEHRISQAFSPMIGFHPSNALPGPDIPWTAAITRQAAQVSDALRNKNERQDLVRSLKILIQPWNLAEAISILKLLSRNVREMQLEADQAPLIRESQDKLLAGFMDIPAWPRLESVSIPVGTEWSNVHPVLFSSSPRLRHLTLIPDHSTSTFDLYLKPWPTLASLRSLTIQATVQAYVPNLIKCLIEASNLEDISLKAAHGSHSAIWWEDLVETLRFLPCLKKLAIDERVYLDWDRGGFHFLDTLIWFTPYQGCYTRCLDTLLIPPLPNLKRLHSKPLYPQSTPDQGQGHNIGHPCIRKLSPDSPVPVPEIPEQPISLSVIMRLQSAPNLQTITFPRTAITRDLVDGQPIDEGIQFRRFRLEGMANQLIYGQNQSHVVQASSGEETHLDRVRVRTWGVLGDVPLGVEQLERLRDVVARVHGEILMEREWRMIF